MQQGSDLSPGRKRGLPPRLAGGNGQLLQAAVLLRGEAHPLPPCYVAVCDGVGRGEYRGLMGSELGEYIG